MGFPVGYTEAFFPNLFFLTLIFLSLLRNLIFRLLRLFGLAEFLLLDDNNDAVQWPDPIPIRSELNRTPCLSAILIREILPVVKFGEVEVSGSEGGSCAVCLTEFSVEEEIRWLRNCRHIFHRGCVDSWMDHDQKTCPLCRTPFVPDDMIDVFNQRLWAASGINDYDYVD